MLEMKAEFVWTSPFNNGKLERGSALAFTATMSNQELRLTMQQEKAEAINDG